MPDGPAAGREERQAERLVARYPHPAQVGLHGLRGVLRGHAGLTHEEVGVDDAAALVVVVVADRRPGRVEQLAALPGTLDDGHGGHRRRRGRS